MNHRIYNFGAGPGMLPLSILEEVQGELLNWQNLGMSVLEVGHRSRAFLALMEDLEEQLRYLLQIPPDYRVLFLGGATRAHFAMIPLNFVQDGKQAGFWLTGVWSTAAYKEAQKLTRAYCIASTEAFDYSAIPEESLWQIQENSAYLYLVVNETINGVRFAPTPNKKVANIPLIADLTSSLLTEPLNLKDYAMVFAGAQKNIANAGLTLAIINEKLLEHIPETKIPTMMNYREQVLAKSMYATLPTFNCYLALKMLKWIKEQGGVAALHKINLQKANLLYNYIDSNDFYVCKVAKNARSHVNICFSLRDPLLEELFLAQAEEWGLFALKGHRTVLGLRASIYNAMSVAGIELLIEFMRTFAEQHSC